MIYQIQINHFQAPALIELLERSTIGEKVTIRQEDYGSLVVSFGNVMETYEITTSGTVIEDAE